MKKKLTAFTLAMAMTMSLAGCAQQETAPEEQETAGVAVQVVEITADTIATENTVVGKLGAENEETIMVGSAAKCTAVYKNAGDTVEKGEKIAALDLGAIIANYNAARIGYDSAVQGYNDQKSILSKQVKLAEDNVANTKALFDIGAASQLEVDQAQISYESAVAGMNSALGQLESAIQSAKSGLEQLAPVMDNVDASGNIIAPISGTLASLNVYEGGFASASMPVAVITGAEQMKITTQVSEALVPQLKSGEEATVYVSSADKTFTATIRSVDRTANYQTQLYTVTLTVPAEVTGLTGAGVTEVLSGLSAGESLVTVGQAYLVDGSAVRVVGGE